MVSSSSKSSVRWSPRCTVRDFLCAMTCVRKSLRALAYASRVIIESRESFGISVGEPIGHSQEGDGVAQLGLALAAVEGAEAFLDVVSLHLALGGEEIRRELRHLPEHRAPDLQRDLVEFLLHA